VLFVIHVGFMPLDAGAELVYTVVLSYSTLLSGVRMAWKDPAFQLGMSITKSLEFNPPIHEQVVPLHVRIQLVDTMDSVEELRALCKDLIVERESKTKRKRKTA